LPDPDPFPMKRTLATLSILFLASTGLRAETAQEIASGFDKQKIAALQAYLEKNPGAKDRDEALSILVDAHMETGGFAAVPDLLSQRYEAKDKGSDADLGVIVNEIVRPFIEASVVSDQRDKAKAFLTKVKGDLAKHPQGEQVAQFLDQLGGDLYLPGVGDKMEIAFTDLKGKEVDLSKMADKVVLVDFWATWCGPCVAEMPNVIAAYGKYKDKGFEVVGISLDEDKAAVEKFVEERKMPWSQYFDGKGWGNEIAQRFGISGIPATFLVGKGGKIVASNLRGPALEEAIEKALGGE
jgi:thiol-disulfide isomerase/thioredoxin